MRIKAQSLSIDCLNIKRGSIILMTILSLPLEDLAAILNPLNIKELIAFGSCCHSTTFLLSERSIVSAALNNSDQDLPLLYFLLLTSPTHSEISKLRLLLTAHPDWMNRPIGMRWEGDKKTADYMLLPLELARNKGAIQLLISRGADINLPITAGDAQVDDVIGSYQAGTLEILGVLEAKKREVVADKCHIRKCYADDTNLGMMVLNCYPPPEGDITYLFEKANWNARTDLMMHLIPQLYIKDDLKDFFESFIEDPGCGFYLARYFPLRALLELVGEQQIEIEVYTSDDNIREVNKITTLIQHYLDVKGTNYPNPCLPQTAPYHHLRIANLLDKQGFEYWEKRGYVSSLACRLDVTLPVLHLRYYQDYHLKLDYYQGQGLLLALFLLVREENQHLFPSMLIGLTFFEDTIHSVVDICEVYGLNFSLLFGSSSEEPHILSDDIPSYSHLLKFKQYTLQFNDLRVIEGIKKACGIMGINPEECMGPVLPGALPM